MNRRSRLTTGIMTLLSAVSPLIFIGTAVAEEPSQDPPVVRIVNADGGVYWRSNAIWKSAIEKSGFGVYTDDKVALLCIASKHGGTVPPYDNNHLWYRARVVSGHGRGDGMVNDHFIDSGTNQPDATVSGVRMCDDALSSGDSTHPQRDGSVFYSGTDEANGSADSAVATTNLPLNTWSSGGNCSPGKTVNGTPEGAETLAGWSRGRLAIIYLLAWGKPDQLENVHQIILFDPGKDKEMNDACDKYWATNALIARWLREIARIICSS